MDKTIILSQDFNYFNMITYDAGPGYANQMGWKYDYLNNINLYSNSIIIIDNRISELECFKLQEYIAGHKNIFFLLKVVDPCEEWCRNHYYYHFLFRIKNLSNVFFLTVYYPSELTKEINDSTGNKKMIFIPYAFNDTYSIKNELSNRNKKIVFSGNLDPHVYPYRDTFIRKIKINPLLWNKVCFLKHPGYPDINQKLLHNVVGNKYIEFLSLFKFMFISPSRCGLEFLKYSECAYAHCVPIGKAPLSFSNKLKEYFIDIDFNNFYKSINYIFSIPITELQDIAENYYSALELERNQDVLNSQLDAFLDNVIA
ncbi:hypothetical protein NIES2107_53520 [Nostoc carneum NIES-2107]|nr:hypothetical protein NIES2107_53520 [Nostoc carneum NIES-2107]